MSLLRVRRSRLVAQIKGDGRRDGVKDLHMGLEGYDGASWGVWVDGTNYQLQGQPPLATTKGWGIIPRRWRSGL